MAILSAATITSCQEGKEALKPTPVTPDIELTAQEISNGILTPEVLWKFGRIGSQSLSPNGEYIAYAVSRFSMEADRGATSIYIAPTAGGDALELTTYATNDFSPQWTPDGMRIAFLSTRSGSAQLYEVKPNGKGLKQITNIPDGISHFWYSPTGNKLLYAKKVQLDRTAADIHPDKPKANVRIIDDLMYRHWDTWHDGKYRHLFIANLGSGKITEGIDIMAGEPYSSPMAPFPSNAEVTWSPCGEMVAYTCKKLKGREYTLSTNSNIYLYSHSNGSTRLLTEGFVGYDKYPSFSPNGKYLAWQSLETPGYESDKHRLMVMNMETGRVEDLTQGFDQNADNAIWSPDSQSLVFISGIKATAQVYRVPLKNGEPQPITQGVHDYTWIDNAGDVLVGSKMSMSMANELYAIDMKTGEETQITSVNTDIYSKINMGEVRERWVKTTDGKDMLVWVILPPNFDENKQYPALLYCQGGPQSTVSQFWSYRWNFQLMAAQGYVVVAPNRRGVPSFGQEWNEQISGDYSGQNIQDYLSAIDDVKREPWVDENRLGAVGASYGGYSAFYLAGVHEGRFKAFISHNGLYNFESFYGSTEENFFPNHDFGGPYWDKGNAIAQRSYANSPHKRVGKWDTPILIIVSEKDFRVPYTQGLEAFNSARLRDIPARLLVYPEANHWILKPQNAIVWHREFFGWLEQWL